MKKVVVKFNDVSMRFRKSKQKVNSFKEYIIKKAKKTNRI